MPAKPSRKYGKNAQNKNGGKKTDKKKSVFFFNLFIAAAVLICLFGAFNNFAVDAQRKARLETLEKEQNSLRIKNDALKNKLKKSKAQTLDEQYIIDFAKAHGLGNDSDIIFYLYPEE
jgi:high-affinity K+ transport system ATPase subunit B